LRRFFTTYNARRTGPENKGKKKVFWLLPGFSMFLSVFFLLDMGLFSDAGLKRTPKEKEEAFQVPDGQADSFMQTRVNDPPQEASSRRLEKTFSVSPGDTLMGLLVREGLARTEAHSVITSLEKVFNPRRLREGQEICLTFADLPEQENSFHSLNLKLGIAREVQVERCDENGFISREIVYDLDTRPIRAESEIRSNLYDSAVKTGVPLEVLVQVIRAYSFDIDFQRDIQPGDRFALLYEEESNRHDGVVRGGALLYACLITGGRTLSIYRYETMDGHIDFFDDRGRSIGKILMVTPIDGARLTSRFGNRRHPVLGYSRMHRGLDFAAPAGTPVMAAGKGIVEFAGRQGNYGNTLRIRHPNEYHTLYAHLSRFASGVRRGARVKQGQTIGYVGSTGLATGPHLHYEVHHRGKPMNPARMDSPPSRTLKGEELERFMVAKRDLDTLFASLQDSDRLALVDGATQGR
jgi:murein DD-endopeptidase MepM/ murein hydrolase activator NlpD